MNARDPMSFPIVKKGELAESFLCGNMLALSVDASSPVRRPAGPAWLTSILSYLLSRFPRGKPGDQFLIFGRINPEEGSGIRAEENVQFHTRTDSRIPADLG